MPQPDLNQTTSYGQEISLRRRAVAFLIAVLVNVALLLMLVFMTPSQPGTRDSSSRLTTFSVNDTNDDQREASSKPKQAKAQARAAATTPTKSAPTPTVQPPVIPVQPTQPNMIVLSHEDFAAADISKLPSGSGALASAGEGSGAGDSGLAGGAGPHGEPLYKAEWYREPTDAELRTYLPRTIAKGAWGDVACQTMPRFHVDNCIALTDSPPGSHLAVAIQQAAWQFLVRPPRVGGKTLVGSWVRIRITFDREAAEGAGR